MSFLRDWATVPDGEAADAVRAAAELYEQETKALEPLLAEKRKGVASPQELSTETREREVDVLSEARKLEAGAIAELERALTIAKGGG